MSCSAPGTGPAALATSPRWRWSKSGSLWAWPTCFAATLLLAAATSAALLAAAWALDRLRCAFCTATWSACTRRGDLLLGGARLAWAVFRPCCAFWTLTRRPGCSGRATSGSRPGWSRASSSAFCAFWTATCCWSSVAWTWSQLAWNVCSWSWYACWALVSAVWSACSAAAPGPGRSASASGAAGGRPAS